MIMYYLQSGARPLSSADVTAGATLSSWLNRKLRIRLFADGLCALLSFFSSLVDGLLCSLFHSFSCLLGRPAGRFAGVFDVFFCALYVILGGLGETRRHTDQQDSGN